MTTILEAQEDLRDPAQAALERQVSRLCRRLKAAELQVAAESTAYEAQAKLAETMARAARAEAQERQALSRANAELAALVRSMEDELDALKAEYTIATDPDTEGEQPVIPSDDGAQRDRPGRESSEAPPAIKRKSIRMAGITVAALCLITVGVGAVFHADIMVFLGQSRVGLLTGRATVIDGGMIRIDGQKVRLVGIDTPPAGTEAGARAALYIRQLTAGQDVRCEINGYRLGADIQARCFIGAVDIGQIMMLSGNAVRR